MRRELLALGLSLAALPAVAQPVVVSREGEGRTLSLTVYNQGRALVRDAREVTLPAGELALEFRDIASSVMPETVAISGEGVTVLEQNYEYDLLSPQTLLAKYVGRDVTLVVEEPGEAPGQVVRRQETGRLLSVQNGTVWRIGAGIVMNPPYRELIFPQVPENLRDRPTLVWLLKSAVEGKRRLEATYLAEQLSWKADYVLTLDEAGDEGQVLGWITLDNQSGASYPDARLQLVAGEVHLAPRSQPYAEGIAMSKAAGAQVSEESFAEYHLYTIPRPTTIKDKQQKQIAFLQADGVKVQRHYVVEGQPSYFRAPLGKLKQDVQVRLEFVNSAANHLGMPLPAGVVRFYQQDRRGESQFIGEDRIDHTPKDERVTMTVGNAFDVVAERRQTDFRRFDSTTESAFEITLRNHKPVPIMVEVRERVGGDWEMLSSSLPYEKTSAFGVEFKVPVPADGGATLTYRVRVRAP
jgi:hypothetical protein